MRKLEDIPKTSVFKVPENYFESLPARVQSRIPAGAGHAKINPLWRYGVQYALPLLLIALLIFYNYSPGPDAETILSSVEATDMIQYLQESGFTTEDVLQNTEFNNAEIEAIENEVYSLEVMDVDEREIDLEFNTL